jgi:hypothetical protein
MCTIDHDIFFQPMVSGINGVTGVDVPSPVMEAGKEE